MIRIQITDGTALQDESRWLAGLSADVDFIQVRERDATARTLARLVRAAMRIAPVLVNDRADVAVACGAAGVHLRSKAVSVREIRRLGLKVITVACHGLKDVEAAVGADFAIVAPVFSPLSKKDEQTPLGLSSLAEICRRTETPVIALGGLTSASAAECVKAGAAGVAGITLFRQT